MAKKGLLMEAKRKKRQHQFLFMIIEAHTLDKTIDKEKLIALASWRWGISRRTALEYLTTLKNADLVEQEDNIISPSKRGLEEIEFPETKLTKEEKEILEV